MKRVKLHHRINLLRQFPLAEEMPQRQVRAQQLGHVVTVILLTGIAVLLATALTVQFARHAAPCPQCLLERAGLLLVGVGLLLNLRTGPRPAHYALVLMAAAFSACVALPHAGAYGGGYGASLDRWMLAAAFIAGLLTAAMLGFELRYPTPESAAHPARTTAFALFVLLAALAAANLASVAVECGFSRCPAAVRYRPPGA